MFAVSFVIFVIVVSNAIRRSDCRRYARRKEVATIATQSVFTSFQCDTSNAPGVTDLSSRLTVNHGEDKGQQCHEPSEVAVLIKARAMAEL